MRNNQRTVVIAFFAVFGIFGVLGFFIDAARLLGLLLIICAVSGAWIMNQLRLAAVEEGDLSDASWEEREAAALNIRATREREQAFFELTNTLSKSLNAEKVLLTVLGMGDLIARQKSDQKAIVSAALLFNDQNKLHVANSRGLTLKDRESILPGQEGILGLALKQEESVFGGWGSRDPELKYISAFADTRSTLAIPLRAGFDTYGVLIFGSVQENAFSTEYVELLKAVSTQTTIALQNATLYLNLQQEKERIVEVDEEARKKLSRDLHDGPTQDIAAITMHLNYARRLIQQDKTQEAQGILEKVEDLARRTTKEIRHMLFTLRPLILETQGLVAALGQLAEKMRDTHGQNVVVEAQQGAEQYLDHHDQGMVFYIVEEAANNARKHAQAKHIWVRLYQRNEYVVIEIEDDGVGFDQSAIDAAFSRNSLGMTNLRDRAEMVKGSLNVNSQPGKGTKISVIIPVKEREGEISGVAPLATPAAGTIKPIAPPRPASNVPASDSSPRKPAGTSPLRKLPSTPPSEPPKPIPFANKRSPSD